MAVPDFIVALRSKIGHDPLPLVGVTGVVFDDAGRVLLVRRADNGLWSLVTGCLDPGEQPACGLVREVAEETGVDVVVERLVSVEALDLKVLPNKDQVYWLDLTFRCRAVSGEARVNDDESLEVGWFELDALPGLDARELKCLADTLSDAAEPRYVTPAPA